VSKIDERVPSSYQHPPQATMPYVPSHLRNQATTSVPEAPSSNPFGGSRQSRAAPDEMPSAFASSRRHTDDPHANPSAFAWGKPRESRDVISLEPTKPQAAPTSVNNPKVIKNGDDGPVFEIYANGAMSAADPVPTQAAPKPTGYVLPSQRVAVAAAPKSYEELFPSLGGGVGALAPAPKDIKYNAQSSAGRSWAAIAQDDSIRLEALRKQEEDRQAAYDAATSIRMNLNDIPTWTSNEPEYGDDAPYCYDYNA
jgi:hypothetical protein